MRGGAYPASAREGDLGQASQHGLLGRAAPRARERDPVTLAHADAAIARSELIVTRQLMTLDAMARCGHDTGRARALLAVMERNLATLYEWRERLLGEG